MDQEKTLSTKSEWAEDPITAPHLILRGEAGETQDPAVVTVQGLAPDGDSGHTAAVWAVAAGRWAGRPMFASGGADRTVRLWDAATGRSHGPVLTDHAAAVTHVAFAGPDRDILLTADKKGDVLRWRVRAGAPHSEPLARLGDTLAGLGTADLGGHPVVGAGTADGVLRVWDAMTGESRAELSTGMSTGRIDFGVLDDGRLVALTIAHAGSGHGSLLTLWDVLAGKPLYEPMTVPEESDRVGTLATVDERLVVVQGVDAPYNPEDAGDVQVIDVATRTVLRRYAPERGWIQDATVVRAAGRTVVLVAADDRVAVVHLHQTGMRDVKDFEYAGHRQWVHCVAATDVGGRTVVASGDDANSLLFWELDSGERCR